MSIADQTLARARLDTREVTVREAYRLLQGDQPPVLLDIREREEFLEGSIDGAVHIPRGFLELRIEENITDRRAPIVVCCAVGIRSILAAQMLQKMGYTSVFSMAGGIEGWKAAGYPVTNGRHLSSEEASRYSRHLLLPEVGERGQAKLLSARVLVVGAGGLGSPCSIYLAASGVGHLGIVDCDVVDLSNLQRQILHGTPDVGRPKTLSAQERIYDVNPGCEVRTFQERLTSRNILDIMADYDIVVDGSDNFSTRYLINDACVLSGRPNIHGSIHRFEGQATVFHPGRGPCYRCLFPAPPPRGLVPS